MLLKSTLIQMVVVVFFVEKWMYVSKFFNDPFSILLEFGADDVQT